MQILKLKLSELTPNTGQIPGLPSNPRQWTKGDVDKIAKSLKETPELFEARPIIAVMYQGQKVILGGNLRYEGARKNKDKEAPVILFPENTPVEKMKEIVIKDNGSFGAWDMDSLANEWDNGNLPGWGVPEWIVGTPGEEVDLSDLEIETNAGAGESKTGLTAITFLFLIDDAELVNAWIELNGKEKLVEKIVEICQEQEAK